MQPVPVNSRNSSRSFSVTISHQVLNRATRLLSRTLARVRLTRQRHLLLNRRATISLRLRPPCPILIVAAEVIGRMSLSNSSINSRWFSSSNSNSLLPMRVAMVAHPSPVNPKLMPLSLHLHSLELRLEELHLRHKLRLRTAGDSQEAGIRQRVSDRLRLLACNRWPPNNRETPGEATSSNSSLTIRRISPDKVDLHQLVEAQTMPLHQI